MIKSDILEALQSLMATSFSSFEDAIQEGIDKVLKMGIYEEELLNEKGKWFIGVSVPGANLEWKELQQSYYDYWSLTEDEKATVKEWLEQNPRFLVQLLTDTSWCK
jgi:hypothetical protein